MYLEQLLGVDGPVEVLAASHGLGEHHAGRVHSLPAVLQVHAPSDLLDEHGSQTLRTAHTEIKCQRVNAKIKLHIIFLHMCNSNDTRHIEKRTTYSLVCIPYFLVHTQEVDLDHLLDRGVHTDVCWHRRNERH